MTSESPRTSDAKRAISITFLANPLLHPQKPSGCLREHGQERERGRSSSGEQINFSS
jgi:hypothetical protein